MKAVLLVALCLGWAGGLNAASAPWTKHERPGPNTTQAKVGLVTRDFAPTATRNWRGMETHTLHTLIWYPASDTATETQQYIGPPGAPIFEAGLVMPHAPFAPAMDGLPVILLSHGTGGSAEQMAWLGTALARAGFVAAAVEHPGDNSVDGMTAEGSTLWWERATDLSEVLDGLLADAELGPHLDKERVGAAGFSLGGYTAMELGGARTDISALYDMCQKSPEVPVCHVPEMKTLGTPEHILSTVRTTSGESLARSGESYRDPRVRAVFAIAPALGFTLTPESLRAMRIPVDVVVGSADTTAPASENAGFIRVHVRGAKMTVLPGVGHYTFLDVCTEAGKQSVPDYCTDGGAVDRETVHRQVDGMATEFFQRTLTPR